MSFQIIRDDISILNIDAVVQPEREFCFMAAVDGFLAEYIVYAETPDLSGEDPEPALRTYYRRSLQVAKENRVNSLAFPMLSSDVEGLDREVELRVAVDEINEFLKHYDMCVLLVFSDTMNSDDLYPDLHTDLDRYILENLIPPTAYGNVPGSSGTPGASSASGPSGVLSQPSKPSPSMSGPMMSHSMAGMGYASFPEEPEDIDDETQLLAKPAEDGMLYEPRSRKKFSIFKKSSEKQSSKQSPAKQSSEPSSEKLEMMHAKLSDAAADEQSDGWKEVEYNEAAPADYAEDYEAAPTDYAEAYVSASTDYDDGYDGFNPMHESKLEERMEHLSDTFSEYLLYLIRDKEMENADVYKRAIVDKKVFSKIKNNPDYHPQKLTALCLCVGAMLNLDETRDLLARAGYALSPCDKTDIIFSYFIENEIYDMIELDIQLEEHGLPCIIS